jgi:hypothetical protein
LALLFSLNANASPGWDRAAHFALSGIVSGGLCYGLQLLGVGKHNAAWDSFALTSLAGAAKEFYMDERPDAQDFTANEIGALVGVSVVLLSFD